MKGLQSLFIHSIAFNNLRIQLKLPQINKNDLRH
jgi:hypothetical protein